MNLYQYFHLRYLHVLLKREFSKTFLKVLQDFKNSEGGEQNEAKRSEG